MHEFQGRKRWFAGISVLVALALLAVEGFQGLAWAGLLISLVGAYDFLYLTGSFDGWLTSELYGEPGEEYWEFRSFVLMVGGPMLGLYAVIFN